MHLLSLLSMYLMLGAGVEAERERSGAAVAALWLNYLLLCVVSWL